MGMKFKKLDWDTRFFGKNVYRLECNSLSDVQKMLKQLQPLSVAYLFSENELNDYSLHLFDKKVTYTCDLNSQKKHIDDDQEIQLFDTTKDDHQQLRRLAVISSKHSRFRKDPGFPNNLVDELYVKWIEKALSPANNYTVIVDKEDDNIIAMVLLCWDYSIATIDLVAVDPSHQGRGIGKSLIRQAQTLSSKKSYQSLKVKTQKDNLAASKLYESCGFHLSEIKYVYHFHAESNGET